MESAWQLYSSITVEHFLTSLYDEDMKCAFATFQGGHGPLKFVAFKKSKKKERYFTLGGRGLVDVAVVVAEVSYYFQPGAPVST